MTEQANKFTAECGLTYSAVFVPQSQSRNAGKAPSLNWRVTVSRGSVSITTDYMQGCAHIPHYSHAFARNCEYDRAVREACETGKTRIIKHKNAYDACQAHRDYLYPKAIPSPDFADVLYCLVSDASVLDYSTFEDWAGEYGYDVDSRAAEKTYRECLALALQLRQVIDLDAAREAFQDY